MVAWVVLFICALIGFVLGQVKLPDSNSMGILKKAGGEYIDQIILKYIKFRKIRKIYTYDKGGEKK